MIRGHPEVARLTLKIGKLEERSERERDKLVYVWTLQLD
jgi:hypothetical protein